MEKDKTGEYLSAPFKRQRRNLLFISISMIIVALLEIRLDEIASFTFFNNVFNINNPGNFPLVLIAFWSYFLIRYRALHFREFTAVSATPLSSEVRKGHQQEIGNWVKRILVKRGNKYNLVLMGSSYPKILEAIFILGVVNNDGKKRPYKSLKIKPTGCVLLLSWVISATKALFKNPSFTDFNFPYILAFTAIILYLTFIL